MTLTIKDTPELNSPGKPSGSSENAEKKSGLSPRSNPVCLEVNITIRSLPGELGGVAQPIREDARTVIVFDNGAVIRTTNNLPVGQTFILSSPSARDVVCRVVGGRNLPNVKGYVEVEFIEPVNDFWNVHRAGDQVAAAAPPAATAASTKAEMLAPPKPSAGADYLETPAKPPSESLGSGPSFEDVAGLIPMPLFTKAPKAAGKPERSGPATETNGASVHDLSLSVNRAASANRRLATPELPGELHATLDAMGASAIASSAPAASHDFMSKGLMAYDQPKASSASSKGRAPLIIGAAAVVLVGISAAVFFNYRKQPPPAPPAAALSNPSTPAARAATSQPPAAPATQDEVGQEASQNQTQPTPAAAEQAQPAAALAPVPALATSAAPSDVRTEARPESRADARTVRRQEKTASVARQSDLESSRRAALPNLKMGSPNAPNRNSANLGDGTAPMTEAAPPVALGTTPSASLLTAAGRTSTPPVAPVAPPSPAPVSAAKTVREPKLLSSTRPVYPSAAKQANIQGDVSVVLSIDATGKVVGAKALSGPLLLRQAAEQSVQNWKYSPALTDGKPTASQATVHIDFRLN